MYKDEVRQFIREMLYYLKDEGTLNMTGNRGYNISRRDILTDLKIFADEVFEGTVKKSDYAIEVDFQNGQTFRITVEEAKREMV